MEPNAITKKKKRADLPAFASTFGPSRYQKLRVIGSGTFGKVYLATSPTGHLVALKRIKKDEKNILDYRVEVENLKRVKHPYCVRMLDYFISFDTKQREILNIVFEYIGQRTLFNYTLQRFPLKTLAQLFFQLASAVDYLHKQGLIHRDLKPQNVVVDDNGASVRLIDFGSTTAMTSNENSLRCAYVVSRYYRAPELLLGGNYNEKVDCWAMGCILYELIVGDPLFKGKDSSDQILQIFAIMGTPSSADFRSMGLDDRSAHYPRHVGVDFAQEFPPDLTPAANLIRGLLHLDPSRRLSMQQVLQHEFFKPVRMF